MASLLGGGGCLDGFMPGLCSLGCARNFERDLCALSSKGVALTRRSSLYNDGQALWRGLDKLAIRARDALALVANLVNPDRISAGKAVLVIGVGCSISLPMIIDTRLLI
jgi:hypothetical protein